MVTRHGNRINLVIGSDGTEAALVESSQCSLEAKDDCYSYRFPRDFAASCLSIFADPACLPSLMLTSLRVGLIAQNHPDLEIGLPSHDFFLVMSKNRASRRSAPRRAPVDVERASSFPSCSRGEVVVKDVLRLVLPVTSVLISRDRFSCKKERKRTCMSL